MEVKKIELRIKLDNAIDSGDINEAEKLLKQLSDIESDYIKPDDPYEFSKHIKNISRKECIEMKRKTRFSKIFITAAAIAAVATVSVSGAMLLKQYSFSNGDKFYTISSNQDIDQDTINQIKNFTEKDYDNKSNANKVVPSKQSNFKSIEEAEKYFNMKIVLPQIMPNLDVSDIRGEETNFGENNIKTEIWATYGNTDEKLFGITVSKKDFKEDVFSLSSNDMDEGSFDEYVSSNGYKFNTFNESNETKDKTAKIFVTSKGIYQYSLSFFNFDENEMHSIVDSLNLEEY